VKKDRDLILSLPIQFVYHGKNDSEGSKILLDTHLKIILLEL